MKISKTQSAPFIIEGGGEGEAGGGVPAMYIHNKIKVFTFIFQNDMAKLVLLTLPFTYPLNIRVLSSHANKESRV